MACMYEPVPYDGEINDKWLFGRLVSTSLVEKGVNTTRTGGRSEISWTIYVQSPHIHSSIYVRRLK